MTASQDPQPGCFSLFHGSPKHYLVPVASTSGMAMFWIGRVRLNDTTSANERLSAAPAKGV
jgi:hypothetical protein